MTRPLSQSEIDHTNTLLARLETPYRERVVLEGGLPQVSASVNNYRTVQWSKAAPQGSGKGIPGVVHKADGTVGFASASARRSYCNANGYADLSDFKV